MCTEFTRHSANYISRGAALVSASHLAVSPVVAAEERVGRVAGGQWPWLSLLRDGGRNALEIPSESQALMALQGKETAFIQLCKHCRESSTSLKFSKLF